MEPVIAGRERDGPIQFLERGRGQSFPAADHRQADPLTHQQRPLLDQVLLEQLHEKFEFVGRTPPVLARQAIERELLDAQPGAVLGDPAHAVHAAPMPFDPRQPALNGPAAVAIHDDGNM